MIEKPLQSSGFDSEVIHSLDGADSQHLDAVTAGQLLREAREGLGLRLGSLAVTLKVPVKKLEALETGRHDLLLDMVFVRALARSVCHILKIDPIPVLALLPHAGRSSFNAAPTEHQASFNVFQSAPKPTGRASVSAPAAIGGLVLVMCVAVLILLPSIREKFLSFSFTGQVKEAVAEAFDKFGLFRHSAEQTVDVDAEVPVPGINELAGPKASPAVSSAAAVDLKAVPGTAVADHIVTFSAAAQPSWVKVTDAKGAVVLSRTISPSEQVSASGVLPLSVVVGRANATRVMVRGVAFDLGAFSKENIARFEVK